MTMKIGTHIECGRAWDDHIFRRPKPEEMTDEEYEERVPPALRFFDNPVCPEPVQLVKPKKVPKADDDGDKKEPVKV